MVRYLETQICTTCSIPCIKTNAFSYTYDDEENRLEVNFRTCNPTFSRIGYATAKRILEEKMDEWRVIRDPSF